MRELGNGHSVAPEAVVSVRMTYGGMQTVLLKLPAQAAKKLLEKQNVQVREVMRPTKCFKCWQYGDISNKCTSEIDRPNCCIKCNLCKEAGNKETTYLGPEGA